MYNPYFGGMPQSNYPQNFNSGFHMNSGPPAPPGMGYGGYGAFGQSAYNNYTGYGGMGTTCAPPFTGFQAVQSTHNSYPMGNIPPPPPQPMPQSYQDQGLLNRMASMELQMQQQAYQNMGYKPPPGPTAPYEGEEQQKQQLSEEEESKPEIDDQVKQKMRQTFIAELQRRYAINGTFELAQGTVVPLLYYPEDDIVVEFYRKERDEDLAKKPWDPEADCEYLRKAMKGAGTTESIITHIVATRCNSQRQELKKQFKTMYGRDLIEDIKSELSGDYKDAILACFVSPAYFDAKCIKKAIYGLGTDEQALIEILMTRTNAQIQEIRDVYGSVARPKNVTKDTLIDQDIRDDTSGDFRKLLVAACQGNRYTIKPEKLDEAVEEILNANQEGTGMFQVNYAKLTDEAKAKREAMRLYKAGEDRWGTDEEQFILIFSTRDFYQLREIFQQYIKITQANVLNAIDEETSGSFKKGLAAISMSVMNRPKYFARKLIKSMKGLGTDEETLIRIVASRSEIDMVQIKAAFLEETNKTLYRYIAEDTSFNFKKILQALVKEG